MTVDRNRNIADKKWWSLGRQLSFEPESIRKNEYRIHRYYRVDAQKYAAAIAHRICR
jgi:hypothetical protein